MIDAMIIDINNSHLFAPLKDIDMRSSIPKYYIYAVLGTALTCSCHGFLRTPPPQFSLPFTGRRASMESSQERRQRDSILLYLSSDGRDNKDFWENQRQLASEMSNTADMSLKE